jgi:hypothetical protein
MDSRAAVTRVTVPRSTARVVPRSTARVVLAGVVVLPIAVIVAVSLSIFCVLDVPDTFAFAWLRDGCRVRHNWVTVRWLV